MLQEREKIIRRAEMVLDVFILAVVFFLAFELRKNFHLIYRIDLFAGPQLVSNLTVPSSLGRYYLIVLFLLAPLWCFMLALNGMYQSMRTKTMLEICWIIIKSAFMVTVAFGAIAFLFKVHFVSRIFFGFFIIMGSITLALEKAVMLLAMHYLRKQGYNFRRLLIVGTGRRAVYFLKKVTSHPEWGFKIIGAVDFEGAEINKKNGEIEVIGTLADLRRLVRTLAIDEVVFIVPRSRLSDIEKSLYACELEGVRTTIAIDFFDFIMYHFRLAEIEDMPFITFETTLAKEWQLFVKRTADIIISGLAIIILSPVFLLTAILIKLTSLGPVFYLQKRIGLNGRRFILYKFRSMVKGAHRELTRLTSQNEMAGPIFKIKNDPRLTPLGRLLRKLSIDELPQLFNVFLGHMSLVGPRPPVLREVKKYEPWQRRRLSMRPGITCLWQVSGRNKIDFIEWMQMDLYYLDNWSLWLDFKILMKTIPVVLAGSGAY